MILSRRAIADFMDRNLDDYRWMKKLTREAIMRELNQLKVKPKFKTEPWLHQLVCFYIGLCRPEFLFLLDMGLGKSKILADLITQIQRERKLEGALITVPRVINIDSWKDDLLLHSDLEPWGCDVSDTEEKWERLAYPKGDVTLIDYAGLHLAACKKEKVTGKKSRLVRDDKKIRHLQKTYNFIGIDESHKLSNKDNLWYGIMNQLCKASEFRYATTGTLFGKDPEALWAQFYLIDRGDTFGENLGLFRGGFFTTKTNPWKGVVYTFDQKLDGKLHTMLQHRSIRYDEDEVLDLPSRVNLTHTFDMGEEQREHYLRAAEGLINADGQLSELDANWLRMRQIVSGYLAWEDGLGKHVLPFKHNPKLDGLERLIDEMGDSKIIVCYDYTETGKLITERIKSMGIDFEWYYGGTKDKSGSRRRFLDDPKCRIFVMNSEAGGTGNDGLQKVARYMVFYETPTPPTTRKQTIKRIHRPGQTQRSFIYDLVMRKTIDKGILAGIAENIDVYDKVVNGKAKRDLLLGL
jgi:hypothetical protein